MIKKLFYSSAILLMMVTLEPVVYSHEDIIEWEGREATYVLLKGVGPMGRLAADEACKDQGYDLIVSPENCSTPRDVLTCISKLGEPLKKVLTEVKGSPLWDHLPEIVQEGEFYRGFWFGSDYHFRMSNGSIIAIRFAAYQQANDNGKLVIWDVDRTTDSGYLSVLCQY